MGCGINLACKTCRKTYYLGYGSYATWIHGNTPAEFHANATADSLDRAKNQNKLKVLTEHEGHDLYEVNWDYHGVNKGALTGEFGPMGSDVPMIPGYDEYEQIDLTKELTP